MIDFRHWDLHAEYTLSSLLLVSAFIALLGVFSKRQSRLASSWVSPKALMQKDLEDLAFYALISWVLSCLLTLD